MSEALEYLTGPISTRKHAERINMTNEELTQLAEPSEKKHEINLKVSGHTAMIIFDLETHLDEYQMAMDASSMAAALFDIQQEIWRPSYRHGYSEPEIADLIKKIDDALEPLGLKDNEGDCLCSESLIRVLMKKYHAILEENNVRRYGQG